MILTSGNRLRDLGLTAIDMAVSQALLTTLYETVLGMILASGIKLKRSRADCHRPAFTQAVMVALKERMSSTNLELLAARASRSASPNRPNP